MLTSVVVFQVIGQVLHLIMLIAMLVIAMTQLRRHRQPAKLVAFAAIMMLVATVGGAGFRIIIMRYMGVAEAMPYIAGAGFVTAILNIVALFLLLRAAFVGRENGTEPLSDPAINREAPSDVSNPYSSPS